MLSSSSTPSSLSMLQQLAEAPSARRDVSESAQQSAQIASTPNSLLVLQEVASSSKPPASVRAANDNFHLGSDRPSDNPKAKLTLKDFLPQDWDDNSLRINTTEPFEEAEKVKDKNLELIPKVLHDYYFQSLSRIPSTQWFKSLTAQFATDPYCSYYLRMKQGRLEELFKCRALIETKILWLSVCIGADQGDGRAGIKVNKLRATIILQEIANETEIGMEDMSLFAKYLRCALLEPDVKHRLNSEESEYLEEAPIEYLKKAANRGNSHAQWSFGRQALSQQVEKKSPIDGKVNYEPDYTIAIKWLFPAAMQQNLWAQVALADLYLEEKLQHLPKAPEGAFWVTPPRTTYLVDDSNEPLIEVQCVRFHVDECKEAAALLYEAAAAQGHNRAKYSLAEMFRNGFVMDREIRSMGEKQARIWTAKKEIALYQSAAEEGYLPAIKRLRSLESL